MNEQEDVYQKYKDQFDKLDRKQHIVMGKELALFRDAMLDCAFTRAEAFELTKEYITFIFGMGIEDFVDNLISEFDDDDEEFADEEEE